MVTPQKAHMAFAAMSASSLNFTGVPAGSLTHIGYGHGHVGHFLFTDSTSGRVYAAAGHDDGFIYIKSSQWAGNIPNYAVDVTKLSSDLTDANVGSIATLFPQIVSAASAAKPNAFVAVTGGATVSIGGAAINSTSALSLLTAGTSAKNGGSIAGNIQTIDPPTPQTGWEKNKKWAIPTIIGFAVLAIGGAIHWAMKK